MRLKSRAETLLETSKQLAARSTAAKQEQVWVDYQNEFNIRLAALQKPVAFYSWFCPFTEIESPVQNTGEFPLALEALKALDGVFVNRPEEVLGGDWIGKARANLGLLATRLSEMAKLDWEQYRNDLHWERAEVWAPFRDHPEHGTVVTGAEAQDHQFDSMIEFPWTEANQKKFESLLTARRETLTSLPVIDDLEVREFIQKAVGQGVVLSEVSTRVFEWLRENGLLGSYVVRRK